MTVAATRGTSSRARFALGLCALAAIAGPLWLGVVAGVGPRLLGWRPIVLTSGSMSPKLRAGDVVVASPFDGRTLEPGTVIVFKDPARPGLLTHRVVTVNADGSYQTKGDANDGPDSTPVQPAAIEAVGRGVVPRVGLAVVWLQNRDAARLLGALGLGSLLVSTATWGLAGSRAGDRARPRADRPVRVLAVVAVAELVAGCAYVAVPSASHAAFSAPVGNGASTFAAKRWYHLTDTFGGGFAGSPHDALFASTGPTNGAAEVPDLDSPADGSPGQTILRSSAPAPQIINELNGRHVQWWRIDVAGAPLTLGSPRLDMWTAVQNKNNAQDGRITAALFDCTYSPPDCTMLGTPVTVSSSAGWGTPNTWVKKSWQFPAIPGQIAVGHALAMKVIVDGTSPQDMWLAYATVNTPSVLTYA